jgi:signal transduction histidine kinase
VNQRFGRLILFTLTGMVVGYVLMHPFAMLAYILGPHHPHEPWDLFLWGRQVYAAFSTEMLVMGLAFSFMGGVAGFGLGAWYLQKERLAQEQLETQRRQAALNTLRELMVTLAHHIRNANMVIGGFSKHMQKHISDPELRRQLELIHRASHEIDDVIASLENISQIEHVQYIDGWRTKMIDLKKELEERLQSSKAEASGSDPRHS